ncbi:helix-turn-helix transcriptional regulator [Bradyrhizobium jicamae]|uniref:helix-turn-helix transcriptional regulator n=1 Tax=Bradyrhizobium jicamae TaxID=280332 RepID=UPI0020117783|nr:AraC family transcriptional regulator [Bradyrhizobium jicamae]
MAMTNCAHDVSDGGMSSQELIHRVVLGLPQAVDTGAQSSLGTMTAYPTVQVTPLESVKRLGTGWHWWFSESVHIPIGSKIEFSFRGPRHMLVLYHEGVRAHGETWINDQHSSRLRSISRRLTFVPAGCTYRERHEASAPTRVTFLYLNPDAFRRSDEGDAGPRVHFEDPLVWETASKLKNAIEGRHDKCLPYLGALSDVLAHELTRGDQEMVSGPAVSRGGLAGWQKRVVVDYVEAHMGERICLPKLAELVRLSLHHFCRAFKQSFGVPAHQYQVRRRMDVAKVMLADRTTSITDIALNLGYAQTSSFSSTFRKTTGWTPTAYRREFE